MPLLDDRRAALVAPVAPYTWEVQSLLPNNVQETGRLPLRWNRPVRILGAYPSVRRASFSEAGLAPTVDDIAVVLDVNNKDRYTNRLDDTGSSTTATYVTLGSLAIFPARVLDMNLSDGSPTLEIAFRWKSHQDITSPLYDSALIGLAFFCEYL